MEERIYEILSSACIENRLLSKEELKEIFNIYININELNNYVNAIEFVSENLNKRVHYDTKENKNNGAGAASSIYEKKIYFDYDIIVKTLKDEDNRYLDYNLVMFLLHEINHFQHYKIIDKMINDKNALENLDPIESSVFFLILSSYYHAYMGIEDEVISNSFLKHIKGNNVYEKFRNHYHKNHDLFPCERLADLDAIEYLRKLLFKYENNDDNLIIQHQILILLKNHNLFKGYKVKGRKLLSPSVEYLNRFGMEKFKIGIKECEYNLNKYNKANASNLLYLGLPVEKEKYNKMHDYYNKACVAPIGLSEDGIKKLTRK
ncbi:MAG: hypothetical protein IJS56_06405 [Bacilli bacterium]|nr:hypothetical protein [Bacilli bacterium]